MENAEAILDVEKFRPFSRMPKVVRSAGEFSKARILTLELLTVFLEELVEAISRQNSPIEEFFPIFVGRKQETESKIRQFCFSFLASLQSLQKIHRFVRLYAELLWNFSSAETYKKFWSARNKGLEVRTPLGKSANLDEFFLNERETAWFFTQLGFSISEVVAMEVSRKKAANRDLLKGNEPVLARTASQSYSLSFLLGEYLGFLRPKNQPLHSRPPKSNKPRTSLPRLAEAANRSAAPTIRNGDFTFTNGQTKRDRLATKLRDRDTLADEVRRLAHRTNFLREASVTLLAWLSISDERFETTRAEVNKTAEKVRRPKVIEGVTKSPSLEEEQAAKGYWKEYLLHNHRATLRSIFSKDPQIWEDVKNRLEGVVAGRRGIESRLLEVVQSPGLRLAGTKREVGLSEGIEELLRVFGDEKISAEQLVVISALLESSSNCSTLSADFAADEVVNKFIGSADRSLGQLHLLAQPRKDSLLSSANARLAKTSGLPSPQTKTLDPENPPRPLTYSLGPKRPSSFVVPRKSIGLTPTESSKNNNLTLDKRASKVTFAGSFKNIQEDQPFSQRDVVSQEQMFDRDSLKRSQRPSSMKSAPISSLQSEKEEDTPFMEDEDETILPVFEPKQVGSGRPSQKEDQIQMTKTHPDDRLKIEITEVAPSSSRSFQAEIPILNQSLSATEEPLFYSYNDQELRNEATSAFTIQKISKQSLAGSIGISKTVLLDKEWAEKEEQKFDLEEETELNSIKQIETGEKRWMLQQPAL